MVELFRTVLQSLDKRISIVLRNELIYVSYLIHLVFSSLGYLRPRHSDWLVGMALQRSVKEVLSGLTLVSRWIDNRIAK